MAPPHSARLPRRAALGCAALLLSRRAVHAAIVPDAQVTIDNFTFAPARVEVAVGTRVVWTNRDDIPHTVTDADNPRAVRSPPLDTDETYARVFDKPGDYRYFCSLHPHMQGTVFVR